MNSHAYTLARQCPDADLVLRAFRHAPEPSLPAAVLLDAAHGLATVHERRHGFSNARREPGISDHHIVACLSKIDEIDCARAELVLEIDQFVARAVSEHPAFLHTESVGAVVDRMALLWAAMNSVAVLPDSESAHRSACAVAELAQAYDDLIGEIASGRRGVPQW